MNPRIVLLATLVILGGIALADLAIPTASASECAFQVYDPLNGTWIDPCGIPCRLAKEPCLTE